MKNFTGKNILLNDNIKYDIVIRGAYGAENFGDDALLYSLIRNISPEKKIAVIGKKNKYINKLFKSIDYYSYDEDIELCADVLLWGGGTQFYDFFSLKFLFKKILNTLLSPERIFYKLLKVKKGPQIVFKKEVYLCVGFGPFASKKKQNLTAKKIGQGDIIYVRDKESYNYLKSTCNSIYKSEDICLLDSEYYVKTTSRKNKIAIVLRDWYYDDSIKYLNSFLDFYKKHSNEFNIEFVLFGKDPSCCLRLKEENIPYLQWDAKKFEIQEFSDLLSQYNLVISARYHGIIFALIHQTPSIAIEIEPKLKLVSQEYNNVLLWKKPFNQNELYNLVKSSLISNFQPNSQKNGELKNIINDIEDKFCE